MPPEFQPQAAPLFHNCSTGPGNNHILPANKPAFIFDIPTLQASDACCFSGFKRLEFLGSTLSLFFRSSAFLLFSQITVLNAVHLNP